MSDFTIKEISLTNIASNTRILKKVMIAFA
jgi:hypothetical protein